MAEQMVAISVAISGQGHEFEVRSEGIAPSSRRVVLGFGNGDHEIGGRVDVTMTPQVARMLAEYLLTAAGPEMPAHTES